MMLPWTRPGRLRLLVLAVSDRCDQRCVHCTIWSGEAGAALSRDERLALVKEALEAGVEEVLITGGEPLLSPDLWPIAERLRAGWVRSMLATNGMLLSRYAEPVGRLFDEVYISLDGASPTTHDRVRGVAAFARVREGVVALRAASCAVQIVARSTLHAGNLHELEAIVESTRRMGFDHVSFLPLDASSDAFGGEPAVRQRLVPSPEQLRSFRETVGRLARGGRLDGGFVLESPAKLLRLGRHLEATAGGAAFDRPACDAPWWSLVVETDGSVRPCFFHERVGRVPQDGLVALRRSDGYRAALDRIRRPNVTCDRCVCPKKRETGLWARVRAVS
jgi:Fe-coproporphyrin III synthase